MVGLGKLDARHRLILAAAAANASVVTMADDQPPRRSPYDRMVAEINAAASLDELEMPRAAVANG